MALARLVLSLVGLFALLLPGLAGAESTLESLAVMALAPLAGQAVVQWPDGNLRLVRVGDQLQGTDATLVQVLPDKLVVEEPVSGTEKALGKRLAWVYKAPQHGGASRVLRLHQEMPASEQPVLSTLSPLPLPRQ